MRFEDKLRQMLDGLEIEEADILLRGAELSPDSAAAAKTLRRISKRERRRIKPFRSTAALAVIILLATLTVLSAGAAFVISAHKGSVDKQFGEGAGDALESRGLLDGSFFEAEHYTLTVDTVLCTGEQLAAVVTLEPRDDETLARVKQLPMLGMSGRSYEAMCSELLSQGFAVNGGGFSSGFDDDSDPKKLLFFLNLDCTCEEGKSYTATLKISELCLLSAEGADGYASRDDEELERNVLGEVTLNISKNIDYRRFESADGTALRLCDIGLCCEAYHELHAFKDEPSLTLVYRDGTSRTLSGTDIGNFSFSAAGRYGGSSTRAGFARLTDTANVTAVVIEGVRYEEVGQ